jgi:hypothetical protein
MSIIDNEFVNASRPADVQDEIVISVKDGHADEAILSLVLEVERLQKVLVNVSEVAKFYKVSSGDKGTLKFGYSRVIEEIRDGLLIPVLNKKG